MIEKINNNQVHNTPANCGSKQPAQPISSPDNQVDVLFQVECKSLANNSLPPEDEQAVQRARELLASGQLDSPENIRAAAEEILKHGI